MNKRNLILQSAVAMAFAVGAGSAAAGTFANGAPAGATYANEIFGTGSSATVIPAAGGTAAYTFAANPAADFLVTYTLDGGAKWGAALTSGSLAATTGCAGSAIALIAGGTTADSTAQFRVTNGAVCAPADVLTLTYKMANAQALATAGSKINLGVTITDNLAAVDTAGTVVAATSASGTSESITAGTALTIDVATNSTKFTGGAMDVALGTFTVASAGAKQVDGTTNWAHLANDAAGTATLTVSGDFSAAANTTALCSGAVTTCGVYIDADSSGNYTAGEEATTLTATAATFKFTSAATLNAASGKNIRLMVNGTSQITEQTPTASLAMDWTNATYADETGSGSLARMSRNGYSTSLYFVNSAVDESTGYKSYVRVSNTSAVSGTVRVTLTTDAGVTGTGSLGTLTAGQSMLITTAQMQTATGVTIPSGAKARITVTGEFPTGAAMGFMMNPGGTLTNMSHAQ